MLSAALSLAAALWGSKPLRWALAAFLGWGSYEVWKHHQRGIGAALAIEKVEKKGAQDEKVAEASRDASAQPGARGRGDPHRIDRVRQ